MVYASRVAAFAVLLTVPSARAAAVTISGTHGAVASEVSECSEAGLSILKQGGSAADGVGVL
jgi:gamma-glutamyltranspeptidase / glutathione hydrolase